MLLKQYHIKATTAASALFSSPTTSYAQAADELGIKAIPTTSYAQEADMLGTKAVPTTSYEQQLMGCNRDRKCTHDRMSSAKRVPRRRMYYR